MPTPKAEKTTKPRKATVKKTAVAPGPIVMKPTHEQIATLAQKYWAERGYSDGHAEHDWLRAEQDLMKAS